MDEVYLARLETLMLQPQLLEKAKNLKIVYTALHGAGGVLVPRMLRKLGFNTLTVPEQDIFDGRFPTVESPNPENAPALAMAVGAGGQGRRGHRHRHRSGLRPHGRGRARTRWARCELLTGNQIGSLIGWYRIKTMFDLGMLNESNKSHAVFIKTFVTTELQAAVAKAFGIGVVNTLTGFKYISAKLEKYEQALPADIRAKYRDMTETETREARLQAQQVLRLRRRGKLRLSRHRFHPGQGWQRRRGHVRRSRGLRGLAGQDAAGTAGRDLRHVRLLPRNRPQQDLRRRGRRGQDPETGGRLCRAIRPRSSTAARSPV